MKADTASRVGISAIATYEPESSLGNDWFTDTLPRKFTRHTGIESRRVAFDDEVTLGLRAVHKLKTETGCDLNNCVAVLFVSPSFVPADVANQSLGPQLAGYERIRHAGRRLARQLGVACHVVSLNWFCTGYSRALSLITQRLVPKLRLQSDQFILVVTATRISRITDYSCKQTAGVFGDLATATLIAPLNSHKYPVHFELLHAAAEKQPADGVYFNFEVRKDVLAPTADGGQRREGQRLVFSLDCMAIADIAPRAMARSLARVLAATGTTPNDVSFVLPHQAGTGITRLTAIKVEELGVSGKIINGLTSRVGNVSSSSIPYGLKQYWSKLKGLVACPAAAVGSPGRAEVSRGCVLLRATQLHESIRGHAWPAYIATIDSTSRTCTQNSIAVLRLPELSLIAESRHE